MVCFFVLMQEVRKQYDNEGAEIGVSEVFEILSSCEEIKLNLPDVGIKTKNGWNILPLACPQVICLHV